MQILKVCNLNASENFVNEENTKNGKIQKKKNKGGDFSEKNQKRPNKSSRICKQSSGTTQITGCTADQAGEGSLAKASNIPMEKATAHRKYRVETKQRILRKSESFYVEVLSIYAGFSELQREVDGSG